MRVRLVSSERGLESGKEKEEKEGRSKKQEEEEEEEGRVVVLWKKTPVERS